jgi:hypothetical protein
MKLTQVSLNRAEGPHNQCYGVVFSALRNEPVFEGRYGAGPVFTNDIESAVLDMMREWGETAPRRGYDKVDFKVYWDTGHSYEGRFDMSFGGLDAELSFFDSLRSRISYQVEVAPPWPFPSQEKWVEHLMYLKEILEGYWQA